MCVSVTNRPAIEILIFKSTVVSTNTAEQQAKGERKCHKPDFGGKKGNSFQTPYNKSPGTLSDSAIDDIHGH
jgi:hypothetical protein